MGAPTSNAEFLLGIFGSLPADLAPWVCQFEKYPGSWGGEAWSTGVVVDGAPKNRFFTLATYHRDAHGILHRADELCAAVYGVMLDDIGTKVARSSLDRLPPSTLVQTSGGNGQATYLFREPVTDIPKADALLAALLARGLGDPNARSASTRYCRLPFGWNSKRPGPPHLGDLIEWRPQNRYTIDDIARAFELEVGETVARERHHVEVPTQLWDSMPASHQDMALMDLSSALECIPADDYQQWIDVGHYLKSLPAAVGFALYDHWSRKSRKFNQGDSDRFYGFKTNRADFRAVFKLASKYGWVNPRHAPAVVFAAPVALPPGASLTPIAAAWQPMDPEAIHQARDFGITDPLSAVKRLIADRHQHADGSLLRAWQSCFYRWRDAHWQELTEGDVKTGLYDYLDRHGGSHYRPDQTKVNKVFDALKHAPTVHLDSRLVPPCWMTDVLAAPEELIACANGLLHLPSRALIAPTPKFFNLNAVPFDYDANAAVPLQWLQFLATIWPNDPEAVATLQELFGYLLTPDTSQQKIFLIVGPKRSGKGTIARVLTELLGQASVAGPTLESLGKDHGLQPLLGTLAAVVSDARLGGKADQKQIAEHLLRISGEDRVTVNRKFLPAITTRLATRFVLLTNELPRIADASGAMASRFVILTMSQSFLGREDPSLTTRLLRELPGVLLWAVEGWHRLHARGHFAPPASSTAAVQELADLGSPITAFVRERCVLAPAAEVSTDALYVEWRDWCVRQGFSHTSDKGSFGRDLFAAFPQLKKGQRRVSGRPVWMYRGIGASQGVTSDGPLLIPHPPHPTLVAA